MSAADKTFHEFVRGGDIFRSIQANASSRNPARWKHVSENLYVWRDGKPGEKTYDFSPWFPGEFGPAVDRLEGYMFALYEHRGGTGEFVPFPDPADEDE